MSATKSDTWQRASCSSAPTLRYVTEKCAFRRPTRRGVARELEYRKHGVRPDRTNTNTIAEPLPELSGSRRRLNNLRRRAAGVEWARPDSKRHAPPRARRFILRPSPGEGFLLPFPSQRDLRGFRRVPRSGSARTVRREPSSCLTAPRSRFAEGRALPCSADNRRRDQMVRRIAAVVLALTLNPALVRAQDTVLTVTVPSADVYKGPSTVTPVIGHVSRGTVLPVSRNLGSWVKIAWPDAPDGVGYVHVTMGRLGPPSADASAAKTSARTSPAPASATSAPASATTTIPPVTRRPAGERMAVRGELNRHTGQSHLRRWRAGRVNEQLWCDGARVAQQPPRDSVRVHARCDDERRRRRPRDVDAVRARSGVRAVRSRERLRLDPSVRRVRGEFTSPDVEGLVAGCHRARLGQWRRLSSSAAAN